MTNTNPTIMRIKRAEEFSLEQVSADAFANYSARDFRETKRFANMVEASQMVWHFSVVVA